MTIEELVGMSAKELSLLTEADIEKYFASSLNVTRPDRAKIQKAKEAQNGTGITKRTGKIKSQIDFEKMQQLARQMGLNV